MVNLNVSIGDLQLKNPVLTASGTFGYGTEFADYIDLNHLGGFIVKGTTINPREGNNYPRMVETPSGMINAVGLQNKGVDHFISNIYPTIANLDTNVIVNVSGANIDDYVATAAKLSPLSNIPAIEVNISCPNVKQGGMAFGTTEKG
ncbi:MAG: dihydroorotate dehydrogenase, partial [Muribaculaceae bacterium]|nr:dihydroorotate dehydrogenase [Muribaculaceae bacterium]